MARKKAQTTNAPGISVGKDVSDSNIISGDRNRINQVINNFPAAPDPRLRAVPPAPPPYFAGREDERARLAKCLLSGEAVAITALHGMGGIGKTALAQKVAEDLLTGQAFPGGVLWWSLGPQPDAFAALSAWAAYFDPQANLTQLPPEARPAFVRAGLARLGRLCAVLDDVWDEESAQSLLAALPPGTAVLLTTRDADLAKALRCCVDDLPALPEDKCLQLLASLLGPLESHADAARDIARLTEGLPLALELIAGLADAPADLPALAEALRQAPQLDVLKLPGTEKREKSLEACFALSYTRLSAPLQMRFRALGVFPAPFDEAALFAVWGKDDAGYLKRLLRRSLLKKEESGLLRQHNLLHAYAAALLQRPTGEKNFAVQRHADYYLEQSWQAEQLYHQGHEHVLEGLRRFEALWPHLQAAYERSLPNAGQPLADRWLSDFPGKISYTLDLRLPPRRKIPLYESALVAARRLKDRFTEGVHLGNLGLAYWNLGEPRRAIAFYEQQLAIVREIGDRHGEGQALGNLGLAYADLGEPRQAIEFYEQDLVIASEIGDKRGEASVLTNLGLAFADLGKPRRAIEFYEQALVIAREIGDKRGEGVALGNLGLAYADLGEPRRAIEYYEQSLVIKREIGDKHSEGSSLGNLGVACKNLGEPRRAMEYYEQQLVIAREIGDKQGETIACWNIGDLLNEQGQFKRAAELMQVRVDYLRAIGHPGAEEAAKQVEKVRKKGEEQEAEKRE